MTSVAEPREGMNRYLVCVLHDAGAQSSGNAYSDEEAMMAAFERVGAFNDRLADEGRLVLAAGLLPREQARHVDPATGEVSDGPVTSGELELGGLWVIDAADDEQAAADLADASRACGQRLELRRFQG